MTDVDERRPPRRAQVARRTVHDLPGPRPWPVVGNTFSIELPRVHQVFEGWARQYGPLVRYRFGGRDSILVADATLADPILRGRPGLAKRANVERIFAEMGLAGVFSAEGAPWRPQRRLAMEALSLKNTRAFFPTLRTVVDRLRRRLGRAAADGRVVEITDDLMRFTVDVTTTLAFGEDMNTLEDSPHGGRRGEVLQTHLAHVFPTIARRIFAPVPYWRLFKLPADHRYDRAMLEIRRVLERLVGATRARLTALPEAERTAHNFLEAMVLARDEQGRPFSDELIFGNTLTMLLAGEDTTAHSIGWALHCVCERPDVIARAQAEVDAVLGTDVTPSDFEQASRLPYLEAIAQEGMRLRPVAPFIGLEAIEDLVVGDVAIPRGTWMTVLSRIPATDARNFTDPTAFRPERWMPGEAPDVHEPSASIPFGSGPRICPGRSLALLEMRVVLAAIFRNFTLERVGSPEAVHERFAFAVTPEGLRLRLRTR